MIRNAQAAEEINDPSNASSNELNDFLSKVTLVDAFGFLQGDGQEFTNVALAWNTSGQASLYISQTDPLAGAKDMLVLGGYAQDESQLQGKEWQVSQVELSNIVKSNPVLSDKVSVQLGDTPEKVEKNEGPNEDPDKLIPGKSYLESLWLSRGMQPGNYIPIISDDGSNMWYVMLGEDGTLALVPVVSTVTPQYDSMAHYKSWEEVEDALDKSVGPREWHPSLPEKRAGSLKTDYNLDVLARTLEFFLN